MAVLLITNIVIWLVNIILLTGRGSFLIAGFNTKPKAEKAKYNRKALSRFMGLIFLSISIGITILTVGAYRDAQWVDWFVWVFVAVVVVMVLFAVIYANTKNRFRR